MGLTLGDFDRERIIDGPSLRREISRVRESRRKGGVGRPIADDSWSSWRSMAGVARKANFLNPYQAVLICYQGFYLFSGKPLNEGRLLNTVTAETLPGLVEAWIPLVSHPRILEILELIQKVALTSDQLEEIRQKASRRTGETPSQSNVLRNHIRQYVANRSRPRHQRFTRKLVCRVVLRPVSKQGK